MKECVITMSEEQYKRLKAMADGLLVSIDELVRNMIFPEDRIIIIKDKLNEYN